ncbi:hypothetical protein EDD85DRAFT_793876 [Armillaria nabsnona]|nr:hypothetical protein EDD85DRAFT_793876 [Armillaria nabsnona]
MAMQRRAKRKIWVLGRISSMAARMISSVGWACSHKLVVVPWARDEVRGEVGIDDALERHSPIIVIQLVEGVIWGENGDWASSAMRMKTGLIFMILHVDNGGCTKEGGILRLRGTVEANIGFGWMVAAAGSSVFG